MTVDRLMVGSALAGWVSLSFSIVIAPRSWWTVLIWAFIALVFVVPVSSMRKVRKR